MKHRSSLILMELLVMAAVFSLSAALCLTAFFRADRISRELEGKDRAILLCRNGAETVKAERDLESAAVLLGAQWQDDRWVIPCEDGTVRLELLEVAAPVAGMGQAEITARSLPSGETVFSVTVGWQEVAP